MTWGAEVLETRTLLAAPVANNDSATVVHDHVLNGTSVLANDFDFDQDPLTAVLFAGPSNGSVSLQSNGLYTYTPASNFAGSDAFTYRAFDGTNYSSVATVNIAVTNTAPTANADSYTIYKDTWNSATEGSASIIGNDLDQNGDALTASLVTGPAQGALTLQSNGAFVYTPNIGFYGTDSFTYRAFDGIAYSANQTVSFNVISPFSAQTNANDLPIAPGEPSGPFAFSRLTGEVQTGFAVAPGAALLYNSATADVRPTLAINTTWNPLAPAPTTVEAQISFNGVAEPAVIYQGSGIFPSDALRFTLQAPTASNLATGRYNWTITLKAKYGASTATRTYSGTYDLVNRSASELGAGWSVAGVDRLFPTTGGQLLVTSTGAAFFFTDTGSGTYASPAGPLSSSTLIRNADQTFKLTAKTGEQQKFSTAGLLTQLVDLNNNIQNYAYFDANGDSVAAELQTITDPFTRVTTFNYSAGKLASVVDFAGRTTSLTRDANGQLLTVTAPDPDAAGPILASVTSFGYDTANRLTTITDAVNQQTTLEYAYSGRLKKATFPDNNTQQFAPLQTKGLVDTSSGQGTSGNPAPVFRQSGSFATMTNEMGQQSVILTDRFGFTTSHTDPTGATTTLARDANGNVTTITRADPDGNGPLTAPVTTFTYDAKSNLTGVVNADGTTESWTYHATLNRPLTHIDQRGFTTSFAYDNTKGNLLSSTDANGKITSFLYSLKGQVTRITGPDPDDAGPLTASATNFQYDTLGRTTRVTNPDNTYRQFTYDTHDNLTQSRDELARITTFAYDLINRVTSVTSPDPDGTGALLPAVESYTYDALGRVVTQTDPLNQITQFGFNSRGWLTTITAPDPDGGGSQSAPVTTFTYDAAGRRTGATDPYGQTTSFAYTADGQISQITSPDPDGVGPLSAPVVAITRDALKRVIEITDPLGKKTKAKYDALDRTIESTTPLGNKTTYGYDLAGNLLTVVAPDPDATGPLLSPIQSFTYDTLGRTVTATDPRGNVTSYAYDNLSRLTSVTVPDPDGAGSLTAPVTSFAYNNRNFVTSTTNALGYVTTYAYDNAGQVTSITEADPDGTGPLLSPVTSYTYDKMGRVTTVTDPLVRKTKYEYDAASQLKKVIDPLSNATNYAYDFLGRVTSITEPDPDGTGSQTSPVTLFNYDIGGRLISQVDALNGVSAWVYDNLGRTTSETDAVGRTVQYVYDANSRMTAVRDPLLNTTSYQYDDDSRLTRIVRPDPDGAGSLAAPQTDYGYDHLGRMTSQTDERGGVTAFVYDIASNLTRLTDPSGNATNYSYDNLNRVTSETNALNATRSYSYDALSQLVSTTDRNGRVTNYSYDRIGRLLQEQWLVGATPVNTQTFSYDAASQLKTASDNSSTYAYNYNNNGRVTSVDNLGTPASPRVVLTSSYDNLNRRTQLTASVNSVADFRNNYTYDSLSRITKITQQNQSGGNSVAAKRIEFAYNAVGQYTSVTRYAHLTDNTKLVATSTYGYDLVGRINSLSHAKSTTTFNAYTWSYDALGRPTQQTSNDGTDTFTYDASSQVTAATHTSQANESNSYDATGNRTNAGYSTGTNNQLLSDGTYSYQYDAEGNRTRKTEIATGNYEDLAWDHHNRLTGIKFYTSAGTLTKEVAYTYDVFDRRIGKQVDNNADGVFDTTQRFIYDGEDIVLVYDGAGVRTNRYLVGPNVDEILADENGAGTVTWSLSDNLGTVRDLVQYNGTTNVTTVVNHIGYTTFGQISSQTNSAFQPLFAYTGREWDGDANLYFYRARWYDPRTARFTSEDPIGFAAGDVNLNRYVFNTPTMWVDPSGMQPPNGPFSPIDANDPNNPFQIPPLGDLLQGGGNTATIDPLAPIDVAKEMADVQRLLNANSYPIDPYGLLRKQQTEYGQEWERFVDTWNRRFDLIRNGNIRMHKGFFVEEKDGKYISEYEGVDGSTHVFEVKPIIGFVEDGPVIDRAGLKFMYETSGFNSEYDLVHRPGGLTGTARMKVDVDGVTATAVTDGDSSHSVSVETEPGRFGIGAGWNHPGPGQSKYSLSFWGAILDGMVISGGVTLPPDFHRYGGPEINGKAKLKIKEISGTIDLGIDVSPDGTGGSIGLVIER